jgi:hypothetical protein
LHTLPSLHISFIHIPFIYVYLFIHISYPLQLYPHVACIT